MNGDQVNRFTHPENTYNTEPQASPPGSAGLSRVSGARSLTPLSQSAGSARAAVLDSTVGGRTLRATVGSGSFDIVDALPSAAVDLHAT